LLDPEKAETSNTMEPIERGESIKMQSANSGREKSSPDRTFDPEHTGTGLSHSSTAVMGDDAVEAEYIHGWTLALVMFALLMSYFLVALDLVRFLLLHLLESYVWPGDLTTSIRVL
jgi:hypothetical protein